MARVVRTEQAEADLEEILEYLDEHSPDAADRFARIFKRRPRPWPGCRKWVVAGTSSPRAYEALRPGTT